ncbi:phosphatase PAP2 family protein [Streptomyces sp. MMS24-I29]|uniref:phosphatase PAP2 family protein n=1 Tax=Streptomyces sp. MMS24-I29 TaxID=3351480 RepID=UPI003C7AD393
MEPDRPRFRPGPPLLCLLGVVVVYLLAVCTPFGQRAENGLVKGYADQARIFELVQSAGPPPLKAAMPTLVAGLVAIAAVALLRRCWWQGCAALAVVVVTVVGTEALHLVLPRPDLVRAPQGLTDGSFPSGHVAVVAGLACGAVLVAAPRVRPYVAMAGMLWLAFTAAAVQALYWHRPSDAMGATLLACACYRVAAQLLPSAATSGGTRPPRPLPALAGVLALVGALAGGAREDAVARPLVFTGAALVCVALYGITTGSSSGPRRSVPGRSGASPQG